MKADDFDEAVKDWLVTVKLLAGLIVGMCIPVGAMVLIHIVWKKLI